MPAAAVIGGSPLGFLVGSTLVPYGTSEYEVIGSLSGEPVEVIKSDLTGLLIPAQAEIVVEGFVDPNPENFREEGPFGEYTGYYSGKAKEEFPKPWLKVERILHRNKPIFWATTVGRPVTDTHMVQSINRTAELWTQLKRLGVPGIQSVYIPPESTGRFWAIISIKQNYPGHGRHAGMAVFATVLGNYGVKGVIVVDEDIRADDIERVLWAISVRYNPIEDTELIKKGRSTPLDPSLPMEKRYIVSRILIDATTPHEWERKPILIEMDKVTMEKVLERWDEFGL
jgi:4-hydroxy-3-polyprenylbenzoate decarboxylase